MFDKKYNKEVFYKLMDLGIKEAKRIRLEFERWLHLLIKCNKRAFQVLCKQKKLI